MNRDLSETNTLYLQIYDKFKREIMEGVYSAGQRLPSIRKTAEDLGVARNTIEAAYRQLLQEGFVQSRTGSGYTVEQINLNEGAFSKSVDESIEAFGRRERQLILSTQKPLRTYKFDFNYENLEADNFPSDTWRKLTADALHGVEAGGASCYNDNQGDYLLRLNIANYLRRSRGVSCFPEQVVIQAGTQAGIQNLMQLFNPRADTVAMEEPGYLGARMAFKQGRFKVIPCPVYQGASVYLSSLQKTTAKLCYVTPSHQFPTGSILPLQARLQLLDWAYSNKAYILEDDYCREFRYMVQPTAALQSLDTKHRVIYTGTFSTTLSPALRMSYLILPPKLLSKWRQHFQAVNSTVPWFSQVVLRRFIEQGHWEKQTRRALAHNKQKYEMLIAAVNAQMKDNVELIESGAGLHILVRVKGTRSQDELLLLAEKHGVGVYGTNQYWMSDNPAWKSPILMGFSSIKKEDIEPGVQALARAWFG